MKSPCSLQRMPSRMPGIGGFSLAEAIVALAVGSVAVSGAMMVNSQVLRLVKSTRDSSAASHSMQERVEQLRIATWKQITDPTYVSQTLFASLPRSVAPLDTYSESVTVTAWPDPGACSKLIVEKTSNSPARIVSSGAGLDAQRLAKVDVQIQWDGRKRSRTRQVTTIISNGGISRMNLPAMGPAGGGTWSSTPTPSTSTSSTPAPAATPAPATPAPTGNGNGRGNVGGKSGTK